MIIDIIQVYLNGERIAVKNFEQYIKMYQNESASNTSSLLFS